MDPDNALESAGHSLLNLAVIKRLQLTAPWRALTLARTLESGPGKTYLGSLEFPKNEAQFMEEALERVTGNWLFR
ncbi:MAG: hypothetical protein P1U82_02060 [Verrucomicrobiales bacterium]|nr:hypothetical protein [Verrucomicrobiales bacterium]